MEMQDEVSILVTRGLKELFEFPRHAAVSRSGCEIPRNLRFQDIRFADPQGYDGHETARTQIKSVQVKSLPICCSSHLDRDIKGVVPAVVISSKIETRGEHKKGSLSLEIALTG